MSSESKPVIIAAALLVAVITFVVFLPALDGAFLYWDDNLLISKNKNIQSIRWVFTDAISNPAILGWYPLTVLSLHIDNIFWGLDPFGYHLTNNILHAVNSFLIFLLIFRLVRSGTAETRDGFKLSLISAFVTSLFFAIHPMRAESVAWITERKDVLFAFFYVLSIMAYLRFISLGSGRTKYYIISILLFMMSLMSKSMAVTLPLVLLILDYFPMRRLLAGDGSTSLKRIIIEKIPFFSLSLIASIFTLLQHHSAGTLSIVETKPFVVRLLVSIKGYSFYLYKFLIPSGLVPWYPYPEHISPLSLEYFGPIVLFLTFTAMSIYMIKRKRLFPSVWFYYFFTLLPIIGITQTAGFAAANRYTYLPCLGPFLLVGVLAGNLFVNTTKRWLKAVFVCFFILISGLLINVTWQQLDIWKDSISLWSYQVETYSDVEPIGYVYRGVAYRNAGRLEDAIKDYGKAIEMDPDFAQAYNNRAVAYEYLEKYDEAIKDYSSAVMIDPKYSSPYFNRGDLYEKKGQMELALKDYTRVTELKPGFARAYSSRARVKEAMGLHEEAVEDYKESLKNDFFAPDTFFKLGVLYLNMGEFEDAVKAFTGALDIRPDFLEAYGNRGTAYLNMSRYDKAVEDFSRVIEFAPGSEMAHINRAIAFMESGDLDQAVSDLKKVLAMNPENPVARDYLKRSYDMMEK